MEAQDPLSHMKVLGLLASAFPGMKVLPRLVTGSMRGCRKCGESTALHDSRGIGWHPYCAGYASSTLP